MSYCRCLSFVAEHSSRDLYKLKHLYDILTNPAKRYVTTGPTFISPIRGFIKGQILGKLTGCEQNLAWPNLTASSVIIYNSNVAAPCYIFVANSLISSYRKDDFALTITIAIVIGHWPFQKSAGDWGEFQF